MFELHLGFHFLSKANSNLSPGKSNGNAENCKPSIERNIIGKQLQFLGYSSELRSMVDYSFQ